MLSFKGLPQVWTVQLGICGHGSWEMRRHGLNFQSRMIVGGIPAMIRLVTYIVIYSPGNCW